MNFHDITKCDLKNGDGIRVVLWVSGCSHGCEGCHNKVTWDPNCGVKFDEEAKKELFDALSKDYISGITFSGGDPLFAGNRETVTELAKEIKQLFPNKTIWLYTGFLFEEIQNLEILNYVDILVDGEFIRELKNNEKKWAGSTNQRIIDVPKSFKTKSIVLAY